MYSYNFYNAASVFGFSKKKYLEYFKSVKEPVNNIIFKDLDKYVEKIYNLRNSIVNNP